MRSLSPRSLLTGIAFLLGSLLTSGATFAHAQTGDPRPASGLSAATLLRSVAPHTALVTDLAERHFDRRDGIRANSVYAIAVDRAGQLWAGTEHGVLRYTGVEWTAEGTPAELRARQVRAVLHDADGGQWYATRAGVWYARGDVRRHYTMADGLPDPTVYSLIETRAIDGTPRIVAGTRSGVSVLLGGRFRKVPLPDGLRPVGLMVAEGPRTAGIPDLWVASADGPVARLARAKEWTVFDSTRGLTTISSERMLIGGSASRPAVFVAGAGGVFQLSTVAGGERFSRVAGAPINAFRMAMARVRGGRDELWVGTRDGHVYRRIEGVWEHVRSHLLSGRGAIIAMEAVARPDGGTSVFVAVGGERLTRIAIGSAAAIDFPAGGPRESISSMHSEAGTDGRAAVWIGSNGGRGLVHIDATGTYRHYSRASGDQFSNVHAIARDTGAALADRGIWIGTDAGPFRWQGGRWQQERAGMPATAVWSLDRVLLPNGASAWTASTSAGLYQWSNARWMLVPGTSALAIRGLATIQSADPALVGKHDLFIMSTTGLKQLGANGMRSAQLPGAAREALDMPNSKAICTITGANGFARVLIGSPDGAVYTLAQRRHGGRIERDPSWRRLPEHIEAATRDLNGLACERPGRLFVATGRGVVVVDIADADMSRWRVVAAASASDGLPPGLVQALSDASIGGVRFVGTPNGIGAVDVARSQIGPTPNLTVQVHSSGRVGAIGEGERLPNGGASLFVRPSLQTDHREEESRFHVRLIPLGRRGLAEMSDSAPNGTRDDEWTDDPSRNYHALAPGEYLLRVRARDFVGREAAPFERRFTVATAPWRTPQAVLAYVLCLVSIALGAHYWRVAGVHRSHQRVIDGERRARASERRFRALFDESGDGHLLASDGMVTAVNDAALALFGSTNAHGLLGRTLMSLVEGFDMTDAGGARSMETTIVRTDGTQTPVSFMLTLIPGDDDGFEHVVLRDLTAVRHAERERLRLEGRVREAQNLESLGTLAGGVAHDFNNLLGVIRGNAELAQLELGEPARVEEHLGEILDASARARDLVRQILTFSRRSSQDTEQVDLSTLVRDMHPMLRRILPASVKFTLHGLDERRVVDGDPTQLQQVLLNLVSNAEYALRQNTAAALDITLSDALHPDDPSRRMISLRVTDNGVGMPASVRERVFEPFYSTKPTGEGTGLGLAVLHGVVVSHRGLISVESHEAVGTRFSILLPASAKPLAGRAPSHTPRTVQSVVEGPVAISAAESAAEQRGDRMADRATPGTSEQRACIVLVDDEPSVARVVDRVLTRAGHVVHTFSNPVEALAFIAADPERPDLLVTDQTMPGMTGDVLAVSARAMRADLPVLILTGFSHRLTQERLEETGAVAVLQKPVALPTLMAAVAQALATVGAGAE